jgi:hypothetical protein
MSPHLFETRHAEGGFAIFIAMIFLLLLTLIVATQARRGVFDERMANNVREHALLDEATESVLRWCEMKAITATLANQPLNLVAQGTSPAWEDEAIWSSPSAYTYTANPLPGLISGPACIIENPALPAPLVDTGPLGATQAIVKYRITARVLRADPDVLSLFGRPREYYLQSELRLVH